MVTNAKATETKKAGEKVRNKRTMVAASYADITTEIGLRVKHRRVMGGMSQTDLADKVGLTFQQIQKYEKGANRISAGMLHQFSQILGVSITDFFDDLPGTENNQEIASTPNLTPRQYIFIKLAEQLGPEEARNIVALMRAIIGEEGVADNDNS